MNLPIYLEINLSTKKVRRFKIDAEMFRYYIGGKTLAAKLLYDLTPAGIDPLSIQDRRMERERRLPAGSI